MSGEVALKACPFCESANVRVSESAGNSPYPRAACLDCGARGPIATNLDDYVEAAALWNTRSSGWQDARAEAFEEAIAEIEQMIRLRSSRSPSIVQMRGWVEALKPLPSSPSGEGGCS